VLFSYKLRLMEMWISRKVHADLAFSRGDNNHIFQLIIIIFFSCSGFPWAMRSLWQQDTRIFLYTWGKYLVNDTSDEMLYYIVKK
jgi:hypothetical protein